MTSGRFGLGDVCPHFECLDYEPGALVIRVLGIRVGSPHSCNFWTQGWAFRS